jgi:hypothetical protein
MSEMYSVWYMTVSRRKIEYLEGEGFISRIGCEDLRHTKVDAFLPKCCCVFRPNIQVTPQGQRNTRTRHSDISADKNFCEAGIVKSHSAEIDST